MSIPTADELRNLALIVDGRSTRELLGWRVCDSASAALDLLADILEQVEEMEWCEVHAAQDAHQADSPGEVAGYCAIAVHGEWDETADCCMVSLLRIPKSALRDVDPDEEG